MPEQADAGLTLIELLVSMTIFTVVAALSTQGTLMIAESVRRNTSTTQSIAEVRLALGSIEREVRSGNAVFNPVDEAAENAACQTYGLTGGSCLRVNTQVNGVRRCVQWQVMPDSGAAGPALLRTRTYSPAWQTDGDLGTWRTAARRLQLPTTASPPFQRPDASTAYGTRLIDVTLIAAGNGRPVTLTSALTGRNTTYGSGSSQCTPGPS